MHLYVYTSISGYARVLGSAYGVNIIVTDTQFLFEISGTMYGIFSASISVYAFYGNPANMRAGVSSFDN